MMALTSTPADCWREAAFRSMAARDWRGVESTVADAVAGRLLTLPGSSSAENNIAVAKPAAAAAAAAATAPPQQRQKRNKQRHTWRLQLAYYGSPFSGYAWQKDAPLPTVEGCLKAAIEPLLQGEHALVLSCAGRTDAGVSALGQQVSFYSWPPIEEQALIEAVAAASPTPGALRVVGAKCSFDRSYHATFSTEWRRYAYLLPPPSSSAAAAASDEAAAAEEALALDGLLQGLAGASRDYAALGRGVPKSKSTSTHLYHSSARLVALPNERGYATRIDLVGDRFIRRQVRTLVASGVAAVAAGASAEEFVESVTSGEQQRTAHPAPPSGLILADAGAEGEPWLPM